MAELALAPPPASIQRDLLDLVVVVGDVAAEVAEQEERDRLADRAPVAAVPVARLAELARPARPRRRSPRAPRAAAACRGVSPGSTWPFGSASTREPSAARRVGTITTTSSPRTTTPPAENSRACAIGPLPPVGVRSLVGLLRRHIACSACGIVDDEAPAALGDHPGALEHGEEAAGGLARGAGELREVGLRGRHEHVRRVLRPRRSLLDQLAEHDRDAALHRLKGLAREPLVGLAQAPAERDHQARRDICGCSVISRRMSGPSTPTTLVCSIASTVAERRSSSNIASSPKMSPGPNVGERDRAPVGVRADRARVAVANDVAGVAGVALAEHRLPWLEAPRARPPRRSAPGPRCSSVENTGTRPSSSTTSPELGTATGQEISHRSVASGAAGSGRPTGLDQRAQRGV